MIILYCLIAYFYVRHNGNLSTQCTYICVNMKGDYLSEQENGIHKCVNQLMRIRFSVIIYIDVTQ